MLEVGAPARHGLRTYVLFAAAVWTCPAFLGQRRDVHLGRFGGPRRPGAADGRRAARRCRAPRRGTADPCRRGGPAAVHVPTWRIGAARRARTPHRSSSPRTTSATSTRPTWKVHFNSARTGVRLVGPKPRWARTDGGEAGLHPSNIHDTPYSVGAVDYTGDMPVLLGPDGPSLGGFVCPATVAHGQRWKLGQLRPGRHGAVRAGDVPEADAAAAHPGRRPVADRAEIADGGILAAGTPT